MSLLTPGNALSVAQNQYRNSTPSTPSSTPSSTAPSSSSSGGSSGGSVSYTAPNYATNTPIKASDFNAGWRHDNNGNWVNINAPTGTQYAGTQAQSAWQKQNNINPTTGQTYTNNTLDAQAEALRKQQEEIAKQQQEALKQQQEQQAEMMRQQQQQQMQMQQQQANAMKTQNDAWMKRQEEMNRNMQRMQAETPDFITNRAKFEQMTGYAGKNEQERKVVDDYWNNASVTKNKNANDYYNEIKSGVAIPSYEQNRPEYAQAQAQLTRIGKYKQMNSGQLANLFKTGELTSGDLALLSKENPSLAMDVAFTNSLNNSGQVDFEKDQLAMSNDIIKNWYTDMQNDERMALLSNALSSDANINNAMSDTKAKADKLGELQKRVLTIGDEVDKELAGKNVSKSYAEALKAKRGSAIHTAIASAQIDYANAMNYQRDLIENKKYDIDYQRQLENRKFQVGQTLFMGRENQRIQQENAEFDMQLGLQKAQAEFEQKLAQDQRIQNDPRLATQQMIESYRKQGINAMRSDAEIIADIEMQVANGRSLGEALTELNKAFQGKEEYKTLMRLHNGQMSEAEKVHTAQQFAERNMALNHNYSMQERAVAQQYGLQNMAMQNQYEIENTMMKYDLSNKQDQQKAVQELVLSGQMSSAEANATMRNINGNWKGANGAELLFAEDGTFIPSTMYTAKTGTNGKGGIECAEYISRMTGMKVGNTWEEKKKLNPEKTGKIGSIMVWQPSKKGAFAKYGHAGIIIGEEGNNWIVKNANYGVDGKISTIKVPKNTAGAQYRSTNLMNQIGVGTGSVASGGVSASTAKAGNPNNTGIVLNISDDAQTWVDSIRSGRETVASVKEILGKDKDSRKLLTEITNAINKDPTIITKENNAVIKKYQDQLSTINYLLDNENNWINADLGDVSGGAKWSFFGGLNGTSDDLLSNLEAVRSEDWIKTIQDAKAGGASFGALSNAENAMIASIGKLGRYIKVNDEGEVTVKASEKQLTDEIKAYKNQLELAIAQRQELAAHNTIKEAKEKAGEFAKNSGNFISNIIASNGKNYFTNQ